MDTITLVMYTVRDVFLHNTVNPWKETILAIIAETEPYKISIEYWVKC